jgi:hypothetical protein
MQGLAPEQIEDLKLKDETDKYYPSGGDQDGLDEIGVRTGRAPTTQLQDVLRRTAAEAKAMVHKVRGGRGCGAGVRVGCETESAVGRREFCARGRALSETESAVGRREFCASLCERESAVGDGELCARSCAKRRVLCEKESAVREAVRKGE